MGKSSIWRPIYAAVSASLVLLCTGFHFGWIGPTLPELMEEFGESIVLRHINWISSTILFGGTCGALLGLILVDICGRKITLLLTTAPFVISCVLLIFAHSYWWIYLARFVAGIGVGVSLMVTPMYICEIAESGIRGSLCTLIPIMIQIGQVSTYNIGFFIARDALEIIGAIIPIVFATSFIWVPESPYYYSMKRKPTETQKSVAWLRETSDVVQEVQEIDNSMALSRRRGMSFLNLFTVLSNRKALLVVIGLLAAQKLSGHWLLSFYLAQFCDIYFGPVVDPALSYIIMQSIQIATGILVVFLVDKVGRRPLLLTSASLCLVFVLAEALYFHVKDIVGEISGISWLPIAALIGYEIGYSIGLGTLPILVAGEIFPCEVKAFALALFTAFHFISEIGVSFLGIALIRYLNNYIAFYIFAVCNLFFAIFIYLVVPETKGRSLSEIQVARQGHFKTQI